MRWIHEHPHTLPAPSPQQAGAADSGRVPGQAARGEGKGAARRVGRSGGAPSIGERHTPVQTPTIPPPRSPQIAYPVILCVPAAVWLLERLSPLLLHGPGVAGMRFHLPTSPLRYLTFKLTNDLRRLPAVRELVRAFLRALFSGDTSQARRGGGKGC